jgi:hypothetical protein
MPRREELPHTLNFGRDVMVLPCATAEGCDFANEKIEAGEVKWTREQISSGCERQVALQGFQGRNDTEIQCGLFFHLDFVSKKEAQNA